MKKQWLKDVAVYVYINYINVFKYSFELEYHVYHDIGIQLSLN